MFRQLLIAALVGLALSAPSSKVDSKLSAVLAKGPANVVVNFRGDIDAIHANIRNMKFATRGNKITFMKSQLEELAASAQKNAISFLSGTGLKFQSFWINNVVHVDAATAEVVSQLEALPEVTEIYQEHILHIVDPLPASPIQPQAEWGINKIEAEQAWALPGGNNGAGVVVSTIDTGARFTHEAIRNNMRTDYNWFDPYNGSPEPMDGNGHGTHVMGTIAGAGGIGVAPGAQWIACRGCNTASCTQAALTACGQFTTCPHLPNGQSPNCDKAPQLSSNSWGGAGGQSWFNNIIDAWRSADIIPVFANGNAGPSCGSVNSPGDNANVIGVGSTTSADALSSFSSRGPARAGTIKPEVSAPGSDVRSSWHTSDTAYNTISGTSMATPHVSGTIALLLSRNPGFTYAQIRNLLENNADRDGLGSVAACGGTGPNDWPNNMYGHGRINARKSLSAAIEM